jgi:8-oxo-dGTP diphosphatase
MDAKEQEFWRHFEDIITPLKSLDYQQKSIYQALNNNSSSSDTVVEIVLVRVETLINTIDESEPSSFEQLIDELLITLLFFIDTFGRDVKVTAKELRDEDPEPVDPHRNQIERLHELVKDKGHDYNSGGVSTISYFIWKEKSILHEMNKRARRLLSLSSTGGKSKFEGAPSTAFDLCSFTLFLLAFRRTFPPSLSLTDSCDFSNLQLATLCYLRKDKRTLLLRKSQVKQSALEYLYNAPGGKIEQGETPRECVLREMSEECGLTPTNLTLKGIVVISGADVHDYSPRDWYVFIYAATEWSGNMLASEEGVPEWVNDSDLQNRITYKGDVHLIGRLDKPGWFEGKIRYKTGEVVETEFYDYLS